MVYTRNPTWQNSPSVATPITAATLENLETGLVAAAGVADGNTTGITAARNRADTKYLAFGYRAAVFGDSITATTNDYSNNICSDSWFTYFLLASQGRLRYAGNYAVGGTTSTQILAQMQSVFGAQYLTKPFDVAFISAGVNDSLDASSLPNPTAANIKAMVALCRQNDVKPVLCTLTPSGYSAGLGASTVGPTATVSATAGTLAAGTYYYAYTRFNTGEGTIGAASTAVTLATAGSVLVTMPGDKGCVYNVYRSTASTGPWAKIAGLGFATSASWIPTQSYTDTGAAAGAAPPTTDGTTANIQAAARLKLDTISRWVRRYAATQGIDCIEFSGLSDGNGQWPVTMSKDGTHPTPATSRLMGQMAWTQASNRFAAIAAQLATDTYDTLNLVQNGCFTNLNGSSLPNQWGGYGGSTAITRTAAPKAGFVGNVYALIRADATPWYDGAADITTGYSVGDRIAFGFKIQTEGIEASNAIVSVGLRCTSATSGPAYIGSINFGADIGPAAFVTEDVVGSGTTALSANYSIANAGNVGVAAPSAKVSLGQVTVFNLTTGQLLTP